MHPGGRGFESPPLHSMDSLKLFGGNASLKLTYKVCQYLGIEAVKVFVGRFSDGEIRVKIEESIRGESVFIIQSTNPPSDNLMELLLMIDAAKRASSRNITAVIPYFGYARQDRKDEPRVPISAKLVANIIEKSGADRVITIDLHAEQIQGFFDIPVDNLYAFPVFKEYIDDKFGKLNQNDFVVVSPDAGGTRRARLFAKKLGDLPIALIDKRRPKPNVAEVLHVIGDVKGKIAIIVDDIVDTGRSLRVASEALMNDGAKEIYAFVTHGLFSGNAKEILNEAPIKEIVITDTIENNEERLPKNARKITISNLLGEAIRRIHQSASVSVLFL